MITAPAALTTSAGAGRLGAQAPLARIRPAWVHHLAAEPVRR